MTENEAQPKPKEEDEENKPKPIDIVRKASCIFQFFTEEQLQDFKEMFVTMDHDQDGYLSRIDMKKSWKALDIEPEDEWLDDMMASSEGRQINYTTLLWMFATMLAGQEDDDDTITAAVMSYDDDGKLDKDVLRKVLTTGSTHRFSDKECDQAFELLEFDENGKLSTEDFVEKVCDSNLD